MNIREELISLINENARSKSVATRQLNKMEKTIRQRFSIPDDQAWENNTDASEYVENFIFHMKRLKT